MREIKFRAWHKKKEKMYEVKEIAFDYQEIIVKRGFEKEQEIIDAGGHHCSSCDSEHPDWFLFRDIILMQYTGFKDIINKEIYEGDIVKIVEDEPVVSGFVGIVSFENMGYVLWRPGWYVEICKQRSHEIIGNVHEHPELLGEK